MGQALKGRFSIWTVGVLAVFLLSCIGYPSQSGFKPKSGRSQAWDALNYANGNDKSVRYEAQKEFIRIFRDAPGLVLSDIDPPYLNALLPKPFVAAPIDGNHNYSFSRLWHYGKAEALNWSQVASPTRFQFTLFFCLLTCRSGRPTLAADPRLQLETKRPDRHSAVIMILTKDAQLPLWTRFSLSEVVPNEASLSLLLVTTSGRRLRLWLMRSAQQRSRMSKSSSWMTDRLMELENF